MKSAKTVISVPFSGLLRFSVWMYYDFSCLLYIICK